MTTTRTHLYADSGVYSPLEPLYGMVTKDQIREEELTSEDVLDRITAEPRREPEWVPEWDEHPEERPGENTRLEEGTLIWERDGFEVRLESYETTHWRVEVDIPEHVGQWMPREIDMKANTPEAGYVDEVETESYHTVGAVLIFQTNFQPVYEVNRWIDDQLQYAEDSEEFTSEVEEKLEVAKEVESEIEAREKEQREPGWSETEEAFVCPHCKETSTHVKRRDDGGVNCRHCDEPIDDHVMIVDDSE
jgi:hypothetical protein